MSESGVATAHSNDAFCVGIKTSITIQFIEMDFLSRRRTRHLNAQWQLRARLLYRMDLPAGNLSRIMNIRAQLKIRKPIEMMNLEIFLGN